MFGAKDDYEEAMDIANSLINDPNFMKAGQRNDNAVNLCIVCRVLGWDEPDKWFLKFAEQHRNQFTPDEIYKALDHIKRVMPYAEAWGPEGNEGEALKYTLH